MGKCAGAKSSAAGNNAENIQAIEAKRILDAAGKDFLIACDKRGLELTTTHLAENLKVGRL